MNENDNMDKIDNMNDTMYHIHEIISWIKIITIHIVEFHPHGQHSLFSEFHP
jgi:hypothetical protein